jgi:hypothetical protein
MGWHWLSLAGIGWHGLAWAGMGWLGLAWAGMGWHGLAWDGMGWHGMSWDGMIWQGIVCITSLYPEMPPSMKNRPHAHIFGLVRVRARSYLAKQMWLDKFVPCIFFICITLPRNRCLLLGEKGHARIFVHAPIWLKLFLVAYIFALPIN